MSIKANKDLFALCMVLFTILLFYLAFPSGGISVLAWVAIVPALIAINQATPRNAFMIGLLAACLGWMCSIWWAVPGIAAITSSPINLALPIIFVFCLICALPYAVFAWLYVKLQLKFSIIGVLAATVIFTVLVNYLPHILPGNLAHALYNQPLLIQSADIGGIGLVFFIVHSVNLLLANSVSLWRKNTKASINSLLVAIVIFSVNAGYGHFRLSNAEHSITQDTSQASQTVTLALIQPNISIEKRTREHWFEEQKSMQTLFAQLNQALNQQTIDLVIFPEVPVPISYQYFIEDQHLFSSLAAQTNLLLTTIKPIGNGLNENAGYFNTIELIANGKASQEYSKKVLLPFGEYLPFEQELPWLRQVFPFAPNYQAGNNFGHSLAHSIDMLEIQKGDDTLSITPLICYEAIFTEQMANTASQSDFIINTSNDAWFFNSAGKRTHLALALFRTIEYRQPMVRVTNNGITGVIDAWGRFLPKRKLAENTRDFQIVNLNLTPINSFYQQSPNAVKYLFILLSLIIILIRFRSLYERNNRKN